MAKRTGDVLIVGGGLQGCAIALFLARAGKRVIVIDKHVSGRNASGVNAGGLRLLMRDVREYPLALRAMEHWENLSALIGESGAQKCEVSAGSSQIALAVNDAEMDWVEARHADLARRGLGAEEIVDLADLRRTLPGLSPSVKGGLVSRRDGHANPTHAAHAFRKAAEGAGVLVLERCELLGMMRTSGGGWRAETATGTVEAGLVVNCAGAWGAKVAAMAGDHLPLDVLALTMMVTVRVKPFIKPVVIGIDEPLSFKQSAVGSLIIGGGISGKPALEHSTSFTVMDRMASSAAATVAAFPALAAIPVVRTWTGLEGKTPDGIPFIGPSQRQPGLWHVFGFCGHGFHLAPAVGEVVARSLIAGQVDPLLSPYSTDRFASLSAA